MMLQMWKGNFRLGRSKGSLLFLISLAGRPECRFFFWKFLAIEMISNACHDVIVSAM